MFVTIDGRRINLDHVKHYGYSEEQKAVVMYLTQGHITLRVSLEEVDKIIEKANDYRGYDPDLFVR